MSLDQVLPPTLTRVFRDIETRLARVERLISKSGADQADCTMAAGYTAEGRGLGTHYQVLQG